jgi:hypothetical protein
LVKLVADARFTMPKRWSPAPSHRPATYPDDTGTVIHQPASDYKECGEAAIEAAASANRIGLSARVRAIPVALGQENALAFLKGAGEFTAA